MDLAWVLLIQIRSLAFILGSPVFGFFSLFFCSPYSTHFLLLILYCFPLFFFVFSVFSFHETTRTLPKGGGYM
jgi:hypothetical protein